MLFILVFSIEYTFSQKASDTTYSYPGKFGKEIDQVISYKDTTVNKTIYYFNSGNTFYKITRQHKNDQYSTTTFFDSLGCEKADYTYIYDKNYSKSTCYEYYKNGILKSLKNYIRPNITDTIEFLYEPGYVDFGGWGAKIVSYVDEYCCSGENGIPFGTWYFYNEYGVIISIQRYSAKQIVIDPRQ